MRQQRTFRPRGITSVMAMLFLVLFSVLAVGFVATVNSAVQISGNELRSARAMLAAESAMNFARFHLWDLNVKRSLPVDELFNTVYEQLQNRLDGTANLAGGSINRVDDVIQIPGDPDAFIPIDDDSGFRVMIERKGMELVVTAVGKYGQTESLRGIELTYAIYSRPSSIFDFGIASKSPIEMIGNTSVQGKNNPAHGSVLTTSFRTPALKMQGNSEISGDVSFVNPSASAMNVTGNNKIGGYRPSQSGFHDHVHFGIAEPEFPTIDTSAHKAWLDANPHTVITGNSGGNKTFGSMRIKANSNPKFNGNTKITGLVYIEAPNQVSFSGNLDLHGVIVVENDPSGDSSTNLIDFGGNVDFEGVGSLPASFGELRDLDGAMLLAPGFKLQMRGNFGVIGGTIAADEMSFSGNAGGTIKGSVINLQDTKVSLQGNTDIIIESQGTTKTPAGMFFGSRYVPLPDTYREVAP